MCSKRRDTLLKIAPAIFIRGGEPWLMGYCWPTPKCQNLCVPHTFLEGKKAGGTSPRKSTPRTLKIGSPTVSIPNKPQRRRNRHERHANSIPTEHGHPTASCFALGSDLTSTDRCRPHPTNGRRRCRSYAGSGGCSRERSGSVWLSKISSSPSRNGPASPPTGLSIIVSPR